VLQYFVAADRIARDREVNEDENLVVREKSRKNLFFHLPRKICPRLLNFWTLYEAQIWTNIISISPCEA